MTRTVESPEVLAMLLDAFESWKAREIDRETLLGYIHGVLDMWGASRAEALPEHRPEGNSGGG